MSRFAFVLLMVVGLVAAKSLEKRDAPTGADTLVTDPSKKLEDLKSSANAEVKKVAEEGSKKVDEAKAAAKGLANDGAQKATEAQKSVEEALQKAASEQNSTETVTILPIVPTISKSAQNFGDKAAAILGSEDQIEGSGEQPTAETHKPADVGIQKPSTIVKIVDHLAEKKPAIDEHVSKTDDTKPREKPKTKVTGKAANLLAGTAPTAVPVTTTESSAGSAILHFGLIAFTGLLIH